MKKTYSRHNSELSGLNNRENSKSDPFDELLSSPLKQDIEFQPLSFWGRKEKKSKAKNKARKLGLFENSDSDYTISCESSGSGDKENSNADFLDELLTPPQKQDLKFQSVNFYNRKEKKSKKKTRKVKCGLLKDNDSDYNISCESSGLGDKENSNADSLDGLLTPPQKQDFKFQPVTFSVRKENDLESQHKFREVQCGTFEGSDFDGFISPCHEISFLSGLQNVTKRRGVLNDSPKKNIENFNVSFKETEEVKLDTQLEINRTLELPQMSERISVRNVTKRKGISNDSYNKNNGKLNVKQNETKEEIELDTQPQIDRTLRLTHTPERMSSQNVTKRRGFLNDLYKKNEKFIVNAKETEDEIEFDTQLEFDQTLELLEMTERMSLDSNKTVCFGHPILESTRVQDVNPTDKKVSQKLLNKSLSIVEDTKFNFGYSLKPGKGWLRSMSVLKQIQNGSIIESGFENARSSGIMFESKRITGRKFESFVESLLEMQNGMLCEHETDNAIEDESCISLRLNNSCSSVLSKSIPDKSMLEKSLLNYTVKVIQTEDKPSAFKSALGLNTSFLIQDSVQNKSSAISARDFVLIQCGQTDVLPFGEYFNERTLKNCKKIGEGVYGEVFMTDDAVIKIIPIEGSDKVNGEPQKTFEEIISEVVIALKLSDLRKGKKYRTFGFSEVRRCWCVKGKYPKYLLELWDEYDSLGNGSENDSPIMFKSDQLFIILELANGGKDLESFTFSSSAQSLSIFIQVLFSLAVAEKAFEFEHRDLHWGNVLISQTKDEFMTVLLNGVEYKIPTKGVKVCIIDFTLSRISHEGCCIFNDLSVDPGLFASEGDYQFEIYRMMLKEVKNDWSLFRPRTNIYWLHYILDKMVKMVRYKYRKAKLHTKHLKDLQTLESIVLKHTDCENFILSDTLNRIKNRL